MSTRSLGHTLGAIAAALIWLFAGSLLASAQPADSGGDDPQSSFAELDRYGQWIQHPEWGTVWVPDVDDDWRPYTVGRWVNTEEHGWYWDSDEPFGWAVYHYGRWLYDTNEGWIWIPGTEWAPAWVAWRYGEDAVGWAPLPPEAIWDPERGVIIDDGFYEAPRYAPFWIFVAPRYLLTPGVHRHLWPARRNFDYFRRTRPATLYSWANRRIYNRGIRVSEIERLTRSRIASVRLVPTGRSGFAGRRGSAGIVYAYRPSIVPSERWRSGRTGDWRRFEPPQRDFVRQQRDFDRPRREGAVESFPRPGRDGRDNAFERNDRNRSSERTGRGDRDPRDGRGQRPATTAVPTLPPAVLPPPPSDRFRRDDGRERLPDGRGRDEQRSRASVPSPISPRVEPPRWDRDGDRQRNERSERSREDGRRGDGGPRPDAGPSFGNRQSPPVERGALSRLPPPPPRPQAAPPPPRALAAPPRPQAAPTPPPPRAQAQPAPRPAPPQPAAQKAQQRPEPKKPEPAPGQQPGPRSHR